MYKTTSKEPRIVEAVQAAREGAKLSRRELSLRLKKSGNFIQKVESGDRELRVSEFVAIARAIDVDPCDLLRAALK